MYLNLMESLYNYREDIFLKLLLIGNIHRALLLDYNYNDSSNVLLNSMHAMHFNH